MVYYNLSRQSNDYTKVAAATEVYAYNWNKPVISLF